MTDWKRRVEESFSPDELELVEYGEPAGDEQIEEAAAALGNPLPPDLRELLSQVNGIATTSDVVFAVETLASVNLETRESYADWKDAAPLDKLLCFSDINGNGDLHAICLAPFEEFRSGQILLLDHETCAVIFVADDLATFFKPWRA